MYLFSTACCLVCVKMALQFQFSIPLFLWQLRNIERNMAERQESIRKKSTELFKLEEDLRLLKKDIADEISDLGGEDLLSRCGPRRIYSSSCLRM